MMKWEYKTVQFEKKGFISSKLDIDELDTELNALGREGWELISFEYQPSISNELPSFAILKRAVN